MTRDEPSLVLRSTTTARWIAVIGSALVVLLGAIPFSVSTPSSLARSVILVAALILGALLARLCAGSVRVEGSSMAVPRLIGARRFTRDEVAGCVETRRFRFFQMAGYLVAVRPAGGRAVKVWSSASETEEDLEPWRATIASWASTGVGPPSEGRQVFREVWLSTQPGRWRALLGLRTDLVLAAPGRWPAWEVLCRLRGSTLIEIVGPVHEHDEIGLRTSWVLQGLKPVFDRTTVPPLESPFLLVCYEARAHPWLQRRGATPRRIEFQQFARVEELAPGQPPGSE